MNWTKREPKKGKVVCNSCYGGFVLSDRAIDAMRHIAPIGHVVHKCKNSYDLMSKISRHDPYLVKVVEELGSSSSGNFSNLRVEVIIGSYYRIDEYDGMESVITKEMDDWESIPDDLMYE